ncbi:MAG: OadG family protein [Lachnospiraceae bacterium]|nr:OadG family protein [Lachnospiraceae bacterium]
MKKRVLVALLAMFCLFAGLGIAPSIAMASSDANETITDGATTEEDYSTYTSQIKSFIGTWNSYDFVSEVELNKDQMEQEDIERYMAWNDLRNEIGDFKSVKKEDVSVNPSTKDITAVVIASYENEDAEFKFVFSSDGQVKDYSVEKFVEKDDEANQSMSDKLAKAGINTVMSICIVFTVLIFIALIISLFKFIPMLFGGKKESEQPAQVAAPAAVAETADVTDDTEIVAVITAAIMASMGSEASADGLHITSIKRRTNSKWKKNR